MFMHHTLAVKTRLETKKYKVKSRLTGFLLKACLLVCVAISWQKSPIGLPEKGAYLIHDSLHPVPFQDSNLNSSPWRLVVSI